MKKNLLNAFNNALKNYCQKQERGYKFGFFSKWRHSFAKTPKLILLEQNLIASQNDEAALMVVILHLLSPGATFNNHSFNNYLIDELQKSELNQIDWACFTPTAIKTYKGVLYRGTSQPPHKIFAEGFKELKSSNFIEDYLKFRNNKIGISTSKDFDCASSYALNNKRTNQQRYIYVINYRNVLGYDILESGKARGLSFNAWLHKDRQSGWSKKEVNIKGIIAKEDIVGAWEIQKTGLLSWIENPNYHLQDDMKRNVRVS